MVTICEKFIRSHRASMFVDSKSHWMKHYGHAPILLGRSFICIVVENPFKWITCRWRNILVVSLFLNNYLGVIYNSFGRGSDHFFMDHVNQYSCSLFMEGLHGSHMRYQHSQNVLTCIFSQVDAVPRFIHWYFFTYMWVW